MRHFHTRRSTMKLLLVALTFLTISPRPAQPQHPTDNGIQPRLDAELFAPLEGVSTLVPTAERRHCFYTYGTQPGFPKGAAGCTRTGASACGGPDQCFCDAKERLV